MNPTYTHVLFPGRHHAITGFQVDYLTRLLAGAESDTDGNPVRCAADAVVVWAVTSASHAHTRRNPIPGDRRAAMIETVAAISGLRSLVVQIPDVPTHPRFPDLVATTVSTDLTHRPPVTAQNTIVACSTPQVAAAWSELGYRVAPVEAGTTPAPAGPWQVVEAAAAGDPVWRAWAHPRCVAFWDRYALETHVRDLFADPVVSAEGDLTATRDYRTYASSFESSAARKWKTVAAHLRPGRVVDIGCATGGLLEHAAADPRFAESDLFGVDVARPLLAEAEHKKATGVFGNPNVWFVRANALTGPVMAERTVDSTVTVALTHEIASYGNGPASLRLFADRIYTHTRPGGVWVNSDVAGPADGTRRVWLDLCTTDGNPLPAPVTDLDTRDADQVAALVGALSTDARMRQFAYDFPRLSGAGYAPVDLGDGRWAVSLTEAMEFVTRKDYTDNWLSECHERFCDLTWPQWRALLTDAGFTLAPGSGPVRNDWLVEHRFNPVATLRDPATGERVDWPETHVLSVAVRATAEPADH